MPIGNSVSLGSVIARIIRNTRLQDTSYLVDFEEWIPEAMGYMQTKAELSYQFEDVKIEFHKGKMPCGMTRLMAIEHHGHRLKTSNTVKHYRTGHDIKSPIDSENRYDQKLFSTLVEPRSMAPYGSPQDFIWETTLVPIEVREDLRCKDEHPTEYYQTEMGYITTSMRDTVIRVHYLAQPLDAEGLPLIPDDEDYKEAIACYVRAKMIGAGYEDKIFSYRELMQAFEMHAGRAMGKLRMPTPDEMETRIDTLVRFIPPANYWENFFRTDHGEKIYDYQNNF
jgi:hypothetical protein